MSTDLVLQFKYTEDEYVEAVQSYYARSFHIKTYVIGISVVLLAGIYLWFGTNEPVVIFGLSVFLLIVALPLIFYFVTPRTTFRREPRFHDLYWLRFAEDGIEFKTEHVNSNLEWSLYQKVWENKHFYLLFYGERLFTIIPKRVFENKAQETQFRELVKHKVIPNFIEY